MDPLRRAISDLATHASHLGQQLQHQLNGWGDNGGAATAAGEQQLQRRRAKRLQQLPGLHAGSSSSSGNSIAQPTPRRLRAVPRQPPVRVSFGPPLCSITQGLFGGGGQKRGQGGGQQKDGGGGGGADGGGGGAAPGGGGGFGGGGKGGKGPKDEDERILISEVR